MDGCTALCDDSREAAWSLWIKQPMDSLLRAPDWWLLIDLQGNYVSVSYLNFMLQVCALCISVMYLGTHITAPLTHSEQATSPILNFHYTYFHKSISVSRSCIQGSIKRDITEWRLWDQHPQPYFPCQLRLQGCGDLYWLGLFLDRIARVSSNKEVTRNIKMGGAKIRAETTDPQKLLLCVWTHETKQ